VDDVAHAIAVQSIKGATTFAPNFDQTRLLEHAQVSRRGRPAVLKSGCQVAGRKFVASMVQERQDVAAGLVRQSGE